MRVVSEPDDAPELTITNLQHAGPKDPHDQPVIDPNYLGEDIDFELIVDSYKFLRKAMATSEWQMYGQAELLPGTGVVGEALRGD